MGPSSQILRPYMVSCFRRLSYPNTLPSTMIYNTSFIPTSNSNVEEVHKILKCHAFDEDLNEYLEWKKDAEKENVFLEEKEK